MPHDTTVRTKGQVTIPKAVRDRHGISVGTKLEVLDQGDDILLRKAQPRKGRSKARDVEFEAYLDRVRGSLDIGMSTDEYMELLRGE